MFPQSIETLIKTVALHLAPLNVAVFVAAGIFLIAFDATTLKHEGHERDARMARIWGVICIVLPPLVFAAGRLGEYLLLMQP